MHTAPMDGPPEVACGGSDFAFRKRADGVRYIERDTRERDDNRQSDNHDKVGALGIAEECKHCPRKHDSGPPKEEQGTEF